MKVTLEGVLFDEKYAKLMQVIFLKGTAALVFYLKFCENSYRKKKVLKIISPCLSRVRAVEKGGRGGGGGGGASSTPTPTISRSKKIFFLVKEARVVNLKLVFTDFFISW